MFSAWLNRSILWFLLNEKLKWQYGTNKRCFPLVFDEYICIHIHLHCFLFYPSIKWGCRCRMGLQFSVQNMRWSGLCFSTHLGYMLVQSPLLYWGPSQVIPFACLRCNDQVQLNLQRFLSASSAMPAEVPDWFHVLNKGRILLFSSNILDRTIWDLSETNLWKLVYGWGQQLCFQVKKKRSRSLSI